MRLALSQLSTVESTVCDRIDAGALDIARRTSPQDATANTIAEKHMVHFSVLMDKFNEAAAT
jgi:hypothetical protein